MDAGALFGRAALLSTVESRLDAGGGAALHGPAGIGKSALLDALAGTAAARGDLVLRPRPVRTERSLPYAGIADLVAQLPPDAPAALPPAQRAALLEERPQGTADLFDLRGFERERKLIGSGQTRFHTAQAQ